MKVKGNLRDRLCFFRNFIPGPRPETGNLENFAGHVPQDRRFRSGLSGYVPVAEQLLEIFPFAVEGENDVSALPGTDPERAGQERGVEPGLPVIQRRRIETLRAHGPDTEGPGADLQRFLFFPVPFGFHLGRSGFPGRFQPDLSAGGLQLEFSAVQRDTEPAGAGILFLREPFDRGMARREIGSGIREKQPENARQKRGVQRAPF